jgi:methyl-accepting chemotaxis protein
VVAEEVRTLAGRSQIAAKETSDMILDSINRVDEGEHIAKSTAQSLTTIISDFENVSKIIDGIAMATSEQADSIGQINASIGQIAQITQENAIASQETATASNELVGQAAALDDIVGSKL